MATNFYKTLLVRNFWVNFNDKQFPKPKKNEC